MLQAADAPPQQQNSVASVQQQDSPGTPLVTSTDATFPTKGAPRGTINESLPSAVAALLQSVAEPVKLLPAANFEIGQLDEEASSEAADEDGMPIKRRKRAEASSDQMCHQPFSASGTEAETPTAGPGQPRRFQRLLDNRTKMLGLTVDENREPCSCPMTPHIVDLLRFCCGYEHLEQNVLLRQHFYGIGHRTAKQVLDSPFALEFLIQWECQHLIPQILRRAAASKEGRRDEASSDKPGSFYRLDQWTDAQVFGSYDAVQEEIASLQQQLEASEKRNEEPDENVRRRRRVLNEAVAKYARSEQACRALEEQIEQLKQACQTLRTTSGIPVGSLRDVLGHLKLTSSLTATVTKAHVAFMDPRTTREVFQICGVNLVVATLFFRHSGQTKRRLYRPEGPLWENFNERLAGFIRRLEGYNPYEDAFRSLTATWDEGDAGLLELCLLVGNAQRFSMKLDAKDQQEAARTSDVTHFFGRIIARKGKDTRERFCKQLKSSVFLNWFYNEPFMQREKASLELQEREQHQENEAAATVPCDDEPLAI